MAETRAVAEKVKVKTPDTFQVRANLYRLAFLQNDRAGMAEQLAFSSGKPGLENELINERQRDPDDVVHWHSNRHFMSNGR